MAGEASDRQDKQDASGFARLGALGTARRWAIRPFTGFFKYSGFSRLLGLALLAAFLLLRAVDPLPLELARLKVLDLFQQVQPREYTPLPVTIVDIDEQSLRDVGQWPWPRNVVAHLVSRIAAAGAVAVAFDIVFAEKDRMNPAAVADWLDHLNRGMGARLRELPSNDTVLAQTFRETRVVLGQAGYPRRLDRDGEPAKHGSVATVGPDPRPYLFSLEGMVRNIPVLEDAAVGAGLLTAKSDPDGILRRVPLMMLVADEVRPTLVLELLRVATGQSTYAIRSDAAGVSSIVVAGRAIPTDSHARMWVRFTGHQPRRFVSATDVLSGDMPADRLRGQLVLIGTSATGLLDIKATPLSPSIPGVEVHAQALETILTGENLVRPNYATGVELAATAGVGLLMILLVPLLGALWALALGALATVALVGSAWWSYSAHLMLFDPSYAMASGLVVYGLLVYVNYYREEVRRRSVRAAFSHYLSPTLVDQLAQQPARVRLGGELRTMTFLFSDVHDFTPLAERFRDNPQGLTRLLNRLLTPLSDEVFAHGGTIDKYMGDCVMAFWNAPLDDPEHAVRACRCALAMLRSIDTLNTERRWEAEAEGEAPEPLRIGIGLNTGDCFVGNMGSLQRFDYSVVGDSVNLASRLEGQTRIYGVPILLGRATAVQVDRTMAVLELDLIRVKGKREPESVYTLLGDEATRAEPAFHALAEAQARMLDCYRVQRWTEARRALAEARSCAAGHFELEEVYDLFAARIDRLEAEPPGPGWDGAYTATAK